MYLPTHAVKKESSTTTKIRAVFDGSAKSSSNISLNDILLVDPTVHSSLIGVLLRFRLHRITLTANMSKMYQAVELVDSHRYLHRFVYLTYRSLSFNDGICANTSFVISEEVVYRVITIIRRYAKWHHPSRNIQVGDPVLLQKDNLVLTKWPMGHIVHTHPGKDRFVCVVTIQMTNGTYKHPITKIELLV